MYAILGFLAQRPMSGYDIKRSVEESVDNFWSESFGQIYPILRRLAEQGMVEKATPESAAADIVAGIETAGSVPCSPQPVPLDRGFETE